MHDPSLRGRFAPSPTGPLHPGSVMAALGSWLMARRAGAEWLVRIEDVDRQREVPGAAAAQLRTLERLGLVSDRPVLRQSARGEVYAAALAQLRADGLAFDCRCSRAALAGSGVHRRCVSSPTADRRPAVRLRVADGAQIAFEDAICGRFAQDVAAEVGDVVLLRADGFWAYQLAVVVDDAAQGIGQVVRGADLLDSTPRQILLQRALGLPTPAYAHLPLLLGEDGAKLSKSLAAAPVDDDDPLPALRMAWRGLGQPDAALPARGGRDALLAAALREFDPNRVPRSPIRAASLHNAAAAEDR